MALQTSIRTVVQDSPDATIKYLKITNPTWVYNSIGVKFLFTLTEQQCLENDIIEIYNNAAGAGGTSDLYVVVTPNVKKPLKINFIGHVENNILGFEGTIDAWFPRGLQNGFSGYDWGYGASMSLDATLFFAYSNTFSPQFIQYENSGYDLILKTLFIGDM